MRELRGGVREGFAGRRGDLLGIILRAWLGGKEVGLVTVRLCSFELKEVDFCSRDAMGGMKA